MPEGWLEHVFLPLGYEATGAWGPKADYSGAEASCGVLVSRLARWMAAGRRVGL